ncbi:MAG: glutamine--fructose-6-phosphate transaminase (isomerizing) [Bordetella sp.]|nr:MAG: glutamine--fructose-6-phosphate transaminase (isomerizing) [Bordetella sp.]
MCGIVGAVSLRDVTPMLTESLYHLEYRGYDSCGIAIIKNGELHRIRGTKRISELQKKIQKNNLHGISGIAHTRWATHGSPNINNAHPHFSGFSSKNASIAIVHNGIIENHEVLRKNLSKIGYRFKSQTDTEVLAHLINYFYNGDILKAVQQTIQHIKGKYAIAVFCKKEPNRIVGARNGSPLVIGIGKNENFLASDNVALIPFTKKFIYLEDTEIVDLTPNNISIFNTNGIKINKKIQIEAINSDVNELGIHQHYMEKEIFEQPKIIRRLLKNIKSIHPELFGYQAPNIFEKIDSVLILGCGTSYYSGMIAKYWIESIAKIVTSVEIASEYRYRDTIPNPNTLIVIISQSGETADTLSALKHAKDLGMKNILSICNVATSSIVNASMLSYITQAGLEVSVASTKSFTSQLFSLFLLTLVLAKLKNRLTKNQENLFLTDLKCLPKSIESIFSMRKDIEKWGRYFACKKNIFLLGRGVHYPIALEGALKFKEICYIHAEAFQSSEMKHGPLALITKNTPIIIIAPKDKLIEKLKSNIQEIKVRAGELHIITDSNNFNIQKNINFLKISETCNSLSPILYGITFQLLAYQAAVFRGTHIDKPRNLAKSVTVE